VAQSQPLVKRTAYKPEELKKVDEESNPTVSESRRSARLGVTKKEESGGEEKSSGIRGPSDIDDEEFILKLENEVEIRDDRTDNRNDEVELQREEYMPFWE